MNALSLQVLPFDARGVDRRFRHAALIGALDTALKASLKQKPSTS